MALANNKTEICCGHNHRLNGAERREPNCTIVTDPKKLRRMLAKRFPEEFDDIDEGDEAATAVSDSIRKEIAIRLLGKLSLEEIAEAVKLDIETVRELAREKEHS